MNLHDKENELFKAWKEKTADLPPHDTRFINDGLFCPDSYTKKTILVLKDNYTAFNKDTGEYEDWDMRNLNKPSSSKPFTNCRKATWAMAARWVHAINEYNGKTFPSLADANSKTALEERVTILNSIGAMNVKKRTSKTATTNIQHLRAWVENCENLYHLKEQWSLYTPQFTICGGDETFEAIIRALGMSYADFIDIENNPNYTNVDKGFPYYKKEGSSQFIIRACHPSARKKIEMKYNYLCNTVAACLSSNKT